ncbi:LamG-like jellyroll fold domain-containing protein [Rufibacter glacialis]|uniref:chitinase n=1 Tax=Rufibacter glacialis TaxID=1259555 RepID=A0A5M8QJ74_9BACT|nr:LamG-like jellyroll fold domain-containing protein [Rufibacter glacialis]KAA6434806.1 T9SS type A sorting domain-containing protein [Rufibacter glacialis]GGK72589.1 hypothetical protein GCM10011405_21040 [Rufibacter glacialis]
MKRVFTLLLLLSAAVVSYGQATNRAAAFAGTATSTASFGNVQELNGVSQFTFEAWVYIDQWNENSYVFSKIGSTTNRIDLQLGTAANKRLYFHVANNANMYAAADNSPITVGKWHHIAMAYDGSQSAYNKIQVFLDGAPLKLWYSGGNGMLPATTPTTTTAPFELGKNFAGKIDEVRLWNFKLNAADLELRNTLNPQHALFPNLIAYWKLDQAARLVDEKATYPGVLNSATLVTVLDNPVFKYRLVSSYIRSNFYETGRIGEAAVLNNNDIIYLAANVYANGDLFFEYPENHGVLQNASHLSSFSGRNGVLDFVGGGASMNTGKDLLNKANGGVSTFTFATWVYVDQWVPGSYLFRKQESALKTIDLQLGEASTSTLVLHLANGADNYVSVPSSGLAPGQWHHVAVTYNGNGAAFQQVKVYVNGVSKALTFKNADGLLPRTGPFIRSDFELGVNFDGKLDETSLNLLSLSANEVVNLKNNPLVVNSWNMSKTNAYWKYDEATQPGKDSRTWVEVLDKLKTTFQDKTGATLRLGVTGGDWRIFMKTDAARRNFASKVNAVLQAKGLDGIDFDFEWAETTQEWADYSATMLAMNDVLPAASMFTVSLHPVYYKISAAAIAAADYISIQSYGPRPNRFPYDQFVADINSMVAYGYPRHKLVMGLPFYGASIDNTLNTAAYFDFVKAVPTLNPASDTITVTLGGTTRTYAYNGQNTIIKKAQHVRTQDLAGLMYWDLATDVEYGNQLSLLRALNTVVNANVATKADQLQSPQAPMVSAQTIEFAPLPEKQLDDPGFEAGATASSGLPVTYTSSNPEVASILEGKIQVIGPGTTVITALQEGNLFYSAAEPVTQTLVVVPDTTPPTAPTNLSATATDFTAALIWSPSTDRMGVIGYQVFQGERLLELVQETGFVVTDLQAAQKYRFTVIAIDKAGNASLPATLEVTTPDTQAPTAPAALTGVRTTKHRINLTWQPASDNVAVLGYQVYLNNVMLNVNLIAQTSYETERPIGNDIYEFVVKAVDAAQNLSAPSNSYREMNGNREETPATISASLLSVASDEKAVRVAPNPASGHTRVTVTCKDEGALSIVLLNSTRTVIKSIKSYKKGTFEKDLSLEGLPAGMYYVRATVGTFSQTVKLYIQ